MRPVLIALLSAPLALAACSPETPREPEGNTPAPPAAVLGGVDLNAPLRVLGTEPFWRVEIGPDGLVYSGVDRPEQRASNAGPVILGTVAEWNALTDQGQPLGVVLTATPCSDNMSERPYPLTARVTIGDETLNGCAATVEYIETTDEQGRPRA